MDNQIIAYGNVKTLLTYDEASANIKWYLDQTDGEGGAMLAPIGHTAYEIVMQLVEKNGTFYAGEDDYISSQDAQRLVDEGLAEYMEMLD